MKSDSDSLSLARALDDEFKRVAKLEDVPMLDLVKEVAISLSCSERQLYNYRSGRWPLPSSYLPPLCQRFNSTLLLDVLHNAIPIEISPTISTEDAWALSKQVIRLALDHSSFAQKALAPDSGFTLRELTEFSQLTDSMIRDLRRVYSFAETAYELAQERRSRTA